MQNRLLKIAHFYTNRVNTGTMIVYNVITEHYLERELVMLLPLEGISNFNPIKGNY